MLKRVLLSIAVLLAVFAIFVATRPDTYRVVRKATISAPPAAVFEQVKDFHRWQAWSPWAHLDPAMQVTYAGTAGEVGSVYAWTGNDKVGAGRMTLVAAQPPARLDIRLEFLRPLASTSETSFAFAPVSGGTEATWDMVGHHNFLGKMASVFLNLDSMIGGDFERGLSQLKAVAEGANGAAPAAAR